MFAPPIPAPEALRKAFRLDPAIRFLNHGSFGAVPRPVDWAASEWRERLEARPIEMLGRRMSEFLSVVREGIGAYLGTGADRVGLVTNATTGIGSVLGSIRWNPRDRIVVTNHGYNAVRQAVHRTCDRHGCVCVVADVALPILDAAGVVRAVMGSVDERTRLVIVDHVTSPTGLVFPVEAIIEECRARGVLTLVDGAHAPGMIPLAIDAIGADWYTGNLHKWVFAPKGSGILVPSKAMMAETHPETTSHCYGQGFVAEFAWQGTRDFANWLAIPDAIEFVESAYPGGAMAHNRALALWAGEHLAHAFATKPISPADGSMIGSLAAIELPARIAQRFPAAAAYQAHLYERHSIEVPVVDAFGRWFVRVSAQVYNVPADYLALESAVLADAA